MITKQRAGVWASAFLLGSALLDAQAPAHPSANLTAGCIKRFDSNADYFPDKVAIEDAQNFTVSYRRSYKLVTIKEGYPGGPAERYVLVQCGAPRPALTGDLVGAQIVTLPLTSLFVFSTTHLSLLADLDRFDVLTGVSQRNVVMDPKAEERINAGKIVEFAKAGLLIDVERVISAKPSLLMAGDTSASTLSVIRSAGVPVVANTEWLEPTALARAEWVKYMALFLNEERKAALYYGEMRARYRALSARATALPELDHPLVMTGRSARGLFVIAGGRSYVAALVNDAGGRYAWADNGAVGSATVDLEAQLQRAGHADIWINGGGWKNLAAMLDDEPRYAAFRAYQQGQVWVYERRQTPTGGNDYWSRSVTRPDLVLADLVHIFHPRLTPDHVLEWYMPVPGQAK
jgi:iron complex transport system substrate-binding protein